MAAESLEVQIQPYEGLDEKQRNKTGESLPSSVFEICDRCHWCVTCLSEKGLVDRCPQCSRRTSKIKLAIDEICYFEKDERRGDTLRFDRALPMR
ncbi:hypothetical protein [Nitrososphaera sp.]|uniref:hypothetical protein n=1 Tax=Nitrososphaera sp. TaxID=1971748 RepID=UPI002ED9B721